MDYATPIAVYSAGNAADYWSTEISLEAGSREANPFGQERAHRLLLKSGSVLVLTGADLVLQKVERRYVVVDRPGFMPERRRTATAKAARVSKWVLRGAAAAYYASVALHNKRVADELRSQR